MGSVMSLFYQPVSQHDTCCYRRAPRGGRLILPNKTGRTGHTIQNQSHTQHQTSHKTRASTLSAYTTHISTYIEHKLVDRSGLGGEGIERGGGREGELERE